MFDYLGAEDPTTITTTAAATTTKSNALNLKANKLFILFAAYAITSKLIPSFWIQNS